MKEKFLIGELSKIFNISADTLRYYDKIGLLKPEYDQYNRYRYYSLENFFTLSRILFLKSLDISMKDIKNYFNNQEKDHLLRLLKSEKDEIDSKINRLINLKGKIESKIDLIEGANSYINEIRIERLPERRGVFIEIEDIQDDSEIKNSLKKHEAHLKMSSWLIEGQVYTSLSKRNVLQRRFDRFNYFIEILSSNENDNTQIKVLKENNYACIVFSGSYDKIEHYYGILIQWIENNGYEIAGDSIEKNIVDYGFSNSEEEYISEIQIPIIPKNTDRIN
jgi:DNA-binding transcriptional MerR regulator